MILYLLILMIFLFPKKLFVFLFYFSETSKFFKYAQKKKIIIRNVDWSKYFCLWNRLIGVRLIFFLILSFYQSLNVLSMCKNGVRSFNCFFKKKNRDCENIRIGNISFFKANKWFKSLLEKNISSFGLSLS